MQPFIKPTILATFSVVVLVGLALSVKPLTAQLAAPQQQTSSATSWMTEKWVGNEKPYAAVRENIEVDLSHGRINVDYVEGLETASTNDERDPLKLFRWAYARYESQFVHPALPFTAMPAEGAFNLVQSPQTYQYARTRFLVETSLSPHPELTTLGKRLLAHHPNDFDVEYGLSSCFSNTLSPSEKQAALTYADRLIKKYPSKASVYSVKGGVYFSYWIDHRDKQDARNAIKWYQRYLSHARVDDKWRKQASSTITLLQSHL